MFESKVTSFQLPTDNSETPGESLWLAPVAPTDGSAGGAGEAGEGELAVDVLETPEELVVIATMAGTKPSDIELHLHNDFLTIRGRRASPILAPAEYFYQECFWGPFSRTIVLPADVQAELARSEYHNGVLTIRLPKSRPATAIPIMVIDE